MNIEILSHDEKTAKAKIKFTHNDVTIEDEYDLSLVIPGSKKVFEDLGQEFTKELQLKVVDKLAEWVKRDIESGALTNRP